MSNITTIYIVTKGLLGNCQIKHKIKSLVDKQNIECEAQTNNILRTINADLFIINEPIRFRPDDMVICAPDLSNNICMNNIGTKFIPVYTSYTAAEYAASIMTVINDPGLENINCVCEEVN